jgi:hypothetical protein
VEAPTLLRLAVACVGLWYVVTVIRRRRHRAATESGALEGNALKGQRWEGLRRKSLTTAFALIVPMAASALLGGPIWLTTALLIGVGLGAGLYLIASAAAGWFEGKDSLRR